MIDLQNNDAVHGDENLREFTPEAFKEAKHQIFNSLHSGDEDIKSIAIDALIQDENFWRAIFSIGTNKKVYTSRDIDIVDFAAIKSSVFCSVSSEIGKLAKEFDA